MSMVAFEGTPQSTAESSPPGKTGNPPSLAQLFFAFLRLGATAYGGPAMVAHIRRMAVDGRAWLIGSRFDEGVALCQMVPGATAMQTAAYVGLNVRGVAGAAASYLGFGLPAFGAMLVLAKLYTRTHALPGVVVVFAGLQVIVVAIVADAAVSFGRTALKSWWHAPISVFGAALFASGLNPFVVVALAAWAGVWLSRRKVSVTPSVPVSSSLPSATKPVLLLLGATCVLLAALFVRKPRLFELTTLMLRIDLLAFGGGFGSIPLLFHEVVSVQQWLDAPTLSDGIVLGQVTPGPIVITATFVGYLTNGMAGAVLATIGVFLPSFVLVIAAAPHFARLRTWPRFAGLIDGILCSFPGLLLIVGIHFAQNVRWDAPRMVLAGAAILTLRLGVSVFWVIVIGLALQILCIH